MTILPFSFDEFAVTWKFWGMILSFSVFFITSVLLEKNRTVGQFWRCRVTLALLLGVLIVKISPFFYRFQEVLDNPWALWAMPGQKAALLGGLFASAGFLSISFLQVRRETSASVGPCLLSLGAGGITFLLCYIFFLIVSFLHQGS